MYTKANGAAYDKSVELAASLMNIPLSQIRVGTYISPNKTSAEIYLDTPLGDISIVMYGNFTSSTKMSLTGLTMSVNGVEAYRIDQSYGGKTTLTIDLNDPASITKLYTQTADQLLYSGNDTFDYRGVTTKVEVSAGAGDDIVYMGGSKTETNTFDLGSGNDTIIMDPAVSVKYSIKGGAGIDTLDRGNVTISSVTKTNTGLEIKFSNGGGHTFPANSDIEFIKASGKSYNYTQLEAMVKSTITTEKHTIDILVNKGVLGTAPVVLHDLGQTITFTNGVQTSNVLSLNGTNYNYADVDALIAVTKVDGKYSAEFNAEWAGVNTQTQTMLNDVQMMGVINNDQFVTMVMGHDGNFVG